MDGCASHTWLQLIPGTLSDLAQGGVFASIHLVFHLLQDSSDFFPGRLEQFFSWKDVSTLLGVFSFVLS